MDFSDLIHVQQVVKAGVTGKYRIEEPEGTT